jgi:Ca2+-binding RTX toxin-like protein
MSDYTQWIPGMWSIRYDDALGILVASTTAGSFDEWSPGGAVTYLPLSGVYGTNIDIAADPRYALFSNWNGNGAEQLQKVDLTGDTITPINTVNWGDPYYWQHSVATLQSGLALAVVGDGATENVVLFDPNASVPTTTTLIAAFLTPPALPYNINNPYPPQLNYVADLVSSEHHRYVLVQAEQSLIPTGTINGTPIVPTATAPAQLYVYDSVSGQFIGASTSAFADIYNNGKIDQTFGDDISEAAGMAAVATAGVIHIYNLGLAPITTLAATGRDFLSAHFSAGGHQLFAWDTQTNDIVVFDTLSWAQIGVIHAGTAADGQAAATAFAGYGQMVTSIDGRQLFIQDQSNGQQSVEDLDLTAHMTLTVTGDATHGVLYGANGADTITGGAENDWIDGGGGNDTLNGGGGFNTVSFASAQAGVTVSLTLQTQSQATGAGTDVLSNFQNLAGSVFGDHLTGDANGNVIDGGGGGDVLTGGAGADTFVMRPSYGASEITDFNRGEGDKVDLSGYGSVLHTFSEVQALMSAAGSDTLVHLPDGDTLKLDGVNNTNLQASDFILGTPQADFSGQGQSNIAWENSSGTIAYWTVSGQSVTGAVLPISVPGWQLQDTGDFNGDGKTGDLVFRNAAGAVAIWDMNGSQLLNSGVAATIGTSWKIEGAADFNGDGKSDLLWENSNGQIAIWQMDGPKLQSSALVATLPTSWHVVGSGDFDGDGKADILWRNAATGDLAIWEMNGTQIKSTAVVATLSTSWHVAGTGDFNGDGKSDLLWTNDTGQVAIWDMNGEQMGPTAVIDSLPTSWKMAGTGDFNNDGKTDIFWRDSNSGLTAVWEMNNFIIANPFLLNSVDNSWSPLNHHYDWV